MQSVLGNDVCFINLKYGVPQGSVIGLFTSFQQLGTTYHFLLPICNYMIQLQYLIYLQTFLTWLET